MSSQRGRRPLPSGLEAVGFVGVLGFLLISLGCAGFALSLLVGGVESGVPAWGSGSFVMGLFGAGVCFLWVSARNGFEAQRGAADS